MKKNNFKASGVYAAPRADVLTLNSESPILDTSPTSNAGEGYNYVVIGDTPWEDQTE